MPSLATRSAIAVRVRWCALALATAVAPLAAQATGGTGAAVAAGDRVRIAREGIRGRETYRYERRVGDTIIVQARGADGPLHIPAWQVTQFHRSLGVRAREAGGRRGLLIGLVLGVTGGAVFGALSADNTGEDPVSPETGAILGGVGFGVAGLTLGYLTGRDRPGEAWESVDPRDRGRFAVVRGAPGIGIAISF